MELVFFKGFFLGAGLIIAIGVQNAFILRQGLKKRHVFASAFTAAFCDAVLIAAGVFGFGVFIQSQPELLSAVKWAGAIFLFVYGAKAFYSSVNPSRLHHEDAKNMAKNAGALKTVLIVLGVTLLNPHVYLDTVVLLGGLSSAYALPQNYLFGAGAVVASFTWFFSLAYGARLLSPLFEKPRAWQILISCAIFLRVSVKPSTSQSYQSTDR